MISYYFFLFPNHVGACAYVPISEVRDARPPTAHVDGVNGFQMITLIYLKWVALFLGNVFLANFFSIGSNRYKIFYWKHKYVNFILTINFTSIPVSICFKESYEMWNVEGKRTQLFCFIEKFPFNMKITECKGIFSQFQLRLLMKSKLVTRVHSEFCNFKEWKLHSLLKEV